MLIFASFISLIFTALVRTTTESNPTLTIFQNASVTSPLCGWSTYTTEQTKCFSWHKTYKQLRSELALANIRGGREAKFGEFPYTVIIEYRNVNRVTNRVTIDTCSGAIINAKWIVTTGHCLDGKKVENFSVYIGYTAHPTQLFGAEPVKAVGYAINNRFYGMKLFTWEKYGCDIGLLKLEKAIDFSHLTIDTVNSVCLPEREFEIDPDVEEYGTVSGWGQTGKNKFNYRRLRALKLKLNSKAKELSWIHTNYSLGTICPGDSGAPLVQYKNGRAVIIGILEGKVLKGRGILPDWDKGLTKECVDDGMPMVFTAISNYIDWIVSTATL